MKILLRICPLMLLLSACVRNIEIEVDGLRQPVVYSVLEAGEDPKVYLYKSLPYEFDLSVNPLEFLTDAEVTLVVNNQRIPLALTQGFDKTIFSGLYLPDEVQRDSVPVFYYTAPHKVLHGQIYQLEATWQGQKITASTRVPNAVDFTRVRIFRDTLDIEDGQVSFRDLLELTVQDDASENNFYKYTVDYQQEAIVETEEGPRIFRVNYSFLRPFFISDQNNNGRTFIIRFLLSDKVNTFQNPDFVFDIQTALISYAPNLIDFNRSLVRQGGDEELVINPFREPVIIRSNINGGLGIFSALARGPVWRVPYQPGF